MKLQQIILMGIFSFIFDSCEKPDFDKLVYETYNGSLAPEYQERYIIEVTHNKITYISISYNNDDIPEDMTEPVSEPENKTRKINKTDFDKIKNKVYDLKVIGCNSSDDCDGGGTHSVTGYKSGKEVFSNSHYGCDDDCNSFYELLKFLNSYAN